MSAANRTAHLHIEDATATALLVIAEELAAAVPAAEVLAIAGSLPDALGHGPGSHPVALIHSDGAASRERACRGCGCTENEACWPPCWWIDADLCSACGTGTASPGAR